MGHVWTKEMKMATLLEQGVKSGGSGWSQQNRFVQASLGFAENKTKTSRVTRVRTVGSHLPNCLFS